MIRLDWLLLRHKRLVLAACLLFGAIALPFAIRQSEHLSAGGFAVSGADSDAVARALQHDFPQVPRSQLGVVLAPAGSAEALRRAVDDVATVAARTEHVALRPAARAQALAAAARGRTIVVPLALDVDEERASSVAEDLTAALRADGSARAGVRTYVVGQGAAWASMRETTKHDLEQAERAGFPLILLVLVVAFGSIGAAALPLAMGFFSVLITGAIVYFASRAIPMSVYVTNMASMIGIGVAVDYSLFILVRYREEIAGGRYRSLARTHALATSGSAVAFSGATVMLALGGLWLVPSNALRSMALGGIFVVAVSVAATVTLLPVLIQLVGKPSYVRSRHHVRAGAFLRSKLPWRAAPREGGFWERWARGVMRHPLLAALGAVTLLVALAIPTLTMRTGDQTVGQLRPGDPTRVGIERAAAVAGPGAMAPVDVLVRAPGRLAPQTVTTVARRLQGMALIAVVAPPLQSRDGRAALLRAVPRIGADGPAAAALIGDVRRVLPAAAGGRAQVQVGGVAAARRDLRDLVAGSMWKIIAFVLAFSFVVLVVVLRSVVLPLKAVVMNLLSVGAAYGVLVLVFQDGWLTWLGLPRMGELGVLTPPLVLAVVFGLSMDYEIFLLTRIRERYRATGDTTAAVADALATSARTISTAAVIMVLVFSVFVFTGVPAIKELGLGNAVAIFIDATIVRLTLVPATMVLLGRWNWWLPRSLDRRLPQMAFD
jgi:uncharacterized membrane protein YdfJ with MMPL/SSD domain